MPSFLDRRRSRAHGEQVRDYLDYLVATAPPIPPSVIDLRDRPMAHLGERCEALLVTPGSLVGGDSQRP